MAKEFFSNEDGSIIVYDLISVIKENAPYLSQVDGAIGDGDHGINMRKGFELCEEALSGKKVNLSTALKQLGQTLFLEIGGSMGPLYGSFFTEMGKRLEGVEKVDAEAFCLALKAAQGKVEDLGGAKLGDKTLLDCLIPASEAFEKHKNEGFARALTEMRVAAEKGKEATRDMVAKVGRSSRLGERSRGVVDAGATSCWLILTSMADSISELL